MPDRYKHLVIAREPLKNDRRTRKINIQSVDRGDLQTHGNRLLGSLDTMVQQATQQITSGSGRYVLKLSYTGFLNFAHLRKHGVEFVSQEGQQTCVAFATEQSLAIFADHLQRLGLEDSELTYQQILTALDGIDNWTPEDRMSWAVQHKGFPDTDAFKLDIELWPVRVTYHPERKQLCDGFERWLQEQQIRQLDKVNLDSLLMYRVQVSLAQAALLLNHRDVRLVDLIPATGISYQQLNREIREIPDNIPSPLANAAKVSELTKWRHFVQKTSASPMVDFCSQNSIFEVPNR